MALYHFSVSQIKRSAGQSALAAAAYRAGERLYSEYYDEISDYTRKGGVLHTEILLPAHAPECFRDRATGQPISLKHLCLVKERHITITGRDFTARKILNWLALSCKKNLWIAE